MATPAPALVFLTTLLLCGAPLAAQSAAGPAQPAPTLRADPGDSVRVTWNGEGPVVLGSLRSTSDSGWAVAASDDTLHSLDAGSPMRVEALRSHGHFGRGFLIGGGVGLAISLLAATEDSEPDCPEDANPAACAFGAALLDASADAAILAFPVFTALLGGVVGALVRHHEWIPVITPGSSPGGDEVGLRWSVPR